MKKVKDWTTLSAEQMLELPLKKWGKRKKQHYDWVCLVPDNVDRTTGYKRYAVIGFLGGIGGSAEIVGYVKNFWYSPWKLREAPVDLSSKKVFHAYRVRGYLVYSARGYIACSRPSDHQHDEMFFAIRKF